MDKPIATPKLVTDIVLKLLKGRSVRFSCKPILAADDTEDPKEHIVFSQLQEPETGWKMAQGEDRKFNELPDGGKTLFRAIVMAWVKTALHPDEYYENDRDYDRNLAQKDKNYLRDES